MDVSSLTRDEIANLRNIPVFAADGGQIGHVGDAYYDEDTGRLECVGIAADAIGFAKRVVPVQGATLDDRGLHLPYAGESVQGSPEVDEELDEERYRAVADHYADARGVTRSEEEIRVGKREVEAGRVRLRKWVETEPVEMNVELQRETARVTREPIDEPRPDAELREEEVEVSLRAEEPVVQKQTVAKEQIAIEKDVAQTTETVRDEVRKERVELDDDTKP